MLDVRFSKTIVYIDFAGDHKPFAKITDKGRQVVCALIARNGEHLTVHKQKDSAELLFTFYSKNKVPSTWDPTKVDLAKFLGYKDPARHGKYFIHESTGLNNGLWTDTIDTSKDTITTNKALKPILGLRIESEDYSDYVPQKYKKLAQILLPSSAKTFWFSIFFTSNLCDFKMSKLQPIKTSLGYFAFQIAPLDEKGDVGSDLKE